MSTSPRAARNFFQQDLTPLLLTGVYLDRFAKSVPFWADVDNLQFTETAIRRRPGYTNLGSFGDNPVRGLIGIQEYGTKVLYAGSLDTIYRFKQDDNSITAVGTGFNLVDFAGGSEWDGGTSIWDGDPPSVWDEGVISADLWSFVNFGTWVIASDDVGPLKIKKNNETFAELQETKISGISIANGGSGHAVGDELTFSGGSGSGFEARVSEVASGVVTGLFVTEWGVNFADGETLTQATTTGSGISVSVTATVPDCPFTRVKTVAKFGPHILAVNYDRDGLELPYDVAWCSEDNPDNWVASATNSAGSFTIREANTPLTCVRPLGENLAVYSEDQMFIVSYTGNPFYFGYQLAMSSGVGAVSPHAVVSVERKNYGLSRRGFFVTDGNSVETIGDVEGINKFVRENVSSSEYPQVTSYHNKKNNEVIWTIPINSTLPDTDIIYNYATGVFSKRTSDESSHLDANVFDHVICGTTDGMLHYEDGGNSEHETYALSRGHDLENPYAIKELTSIRVGKTGIGSVQLRIGWADTADAVATQKEAFNTGADLITFTETILISDNTAKEHSLRTAGRYLYLELSSSDASDTWEISYIEVKGRVRGFR